MAGGKQTPRQKLVSLMYLVFITMVALNVSTEVLRSFVIVNESMERTNENLRDNVVSTHMMFERALAEDRDRFQENFDKAQEAQRLTAELREHIRLARRDLVVMAERVPPEVADTLNPRAIRRQDDYSTPTRLFINDGRGLKLRNEIEQHVINMLNLLPESNQDNIMQPFDTEGPFRDANGMIIPWERANFDGVVIVAAITILNQLKNNALNFELEVVNELFRMVSDGDLTFDNVQARIVPRSTFVALGETFEAEVFMVAWDGRQRVMANINGRNIESRDGVVRFSVPATSEGVFPVSGWIDFDGDRLPFRTEYVVAAPAASVSAEAMNVFYIGVDNPITAAVSGVDPGNVRVSISGAGATITPIPGGGNRYIVRATTPGEAVITVSARTNDGGTRNVGEFRYRVRRVPDPVVVVAGLGDRDTHVAASVLAGAGGLVARMPGFDFELAVQVNSFTMSTTVAGSFVELRSTNNRFTDAMITQMRNARPGQRFNFDNINVQMPTGPEATRPFSLIIR
ncbi:MAG: gliding motility protein GldM [Bacteroidales bacterium]|nr:gliding motility protein GldM [Bacteroidales bacterium]